MADNQSGSYANRNDPFASFTPEVREQLLRMPKDQLSGLIAALNSNSTNSKSPVSHRKQQHSNTEANTGVPRGLSKSRVAELLQLPPSEHELDITDKACNRSPFCATYGAQNQIIKDTLLIQRKYRFVVSLSFYYSLYHIYYIGTPSGQSYTSPQLSPLIF